MVAGALGAVMGFIIAVLVWIFLGEAAWGPPRVDQRSVAIQEARLDPSGRRLELVVDSCNGAPRASVRQGVSFVEIEVVAFVIMDAEDDCQSLLEVTLPTGVSDPRQLVDLHSGDVVDVISASGG
jgi:hypothetical protein